MRFGGRVQPIDGLGGECDGGVESETVRRAGDVVIDGFRHADDRNPALGELMCDGQRAVAADDHERVEPHLAERLHDAVGIVAGPVGSLDGMGEGIAAIGRAENRAAEAQDAGDVARRERPRSTWLDQTVEAVFEADALDAGVAGGLDDGTDDGVQAGGVTAAGEDADAGNRSDHVDCRASGQSILPTIANGDGAGARQRKSAVVDSTVDIGHGRVPERGTSWAASSVGRARRSQRRGHEFEPRAVHHQILRKPVDLGHAESEGDIGPRTRLGVKCPHVEARSG